MILDEIIASAKIHIQNRKEIVSPKDLIKQMDNAEFRNCSFKSALQEKGKVSIIGEIKKASPSKGLIRKNFNHIEIAKEYAVSDIQALSVLTEPDYFKGDLSFIDDISKIVDIPILRKDFIIDEYQIYEAKLHGADAILLIMAALNDNEFTKLYNCAKKLGLDVLVETHNKDEILRAESAEIIGVNNRNLQTFDEDITTLERVREYIPENAVVVGESAIRSHADYKYLESLDIDAMLIGEAFMREKSVSDAVRKLRCGA